MKLTQAASPANHIPPPAQPKRPLTPWQERHRKVRPRPQTPPPVRSGWTRRYQQSGEHIEPQTNSANGASAGQPTHYGPTDRKRSQSNTAINTVEDKSHIKKLPAAQTTPTMMPETLPRYENKRGTAASNAINIDAKPVEARAVVPATNGPGPSPATDPAPSTEGESLRLWVSIAAALALVALCSVAFIGVRLARRRN